MTPAEHPAARTPADELCAAVELLPDEPLRARVITVPDQDPALATRHTVVVCQWDHLELDEQRLDAFGCCCECRFLASYDPELAQLVVGLLNAAGPLRALLGDDVEWCETNPAHKHKVVAKGLAVARGILGGQP